MPGSSKTNAVFTVRFRGDAAVLQGRGWPSVTDSLMSLLIVCFLSFWFFPFSPLWPAISGALPTSHMYSWAFRNVWWLILAFWGVVTAADTVFQSWARGVVFASATRTSVVLPRLGLTLARGSVVGVAEVSGQEPGDSDGGFRKIMIAVRASCGEQPLRVHEIVQASYACPTEGWARASELPFLGFFDVGKVRPSSAGVSDAAARELVRRLTAPAVGGGAESE